MIKFSNIDFKRILELNFKKGNCIYYGDPSDFIQIFLNLLNNSLDAMEMNPKLLRVRIKIELKDNFYIIEYSDNGPGIAEELKSNMFEPFQTSKLGDTSHYGLGMSNIKLIITRIYAGEIRIDPNYRDGAKFIITLPIAKSSD